ncbi:MAG: 50S ribosomal protein L30 [Aigarchaeota archaeon]|nr:50S ribosomal protein L30 [Candidatus Calditenuis fumarioli]
MSEEPRCLLVVRLRGPSGTSEEIEYSLRLIRLKRSNWATLVRNEPSQLGLLRKVAPYVTWGEPDPKVLAAVLEKRAETWNGVPKEKAYEELGCRDALELATKVCSGEIDLKALWFRFKPYFRLHPPKGGLKRSIKRFYGDKGEAGYRGPAINDLVIRMV